ncbi:MAG: redoxin domain-containing protein [Gammaproteobacteria bacterium]|nr:redoxin domain-containing protein [Gammaproteobacteria bacterium]
MIALLATIPWPAWSGDEGQITLPSFEFSPDMPWLNVSKPIRLSELKGKVVVLDFWTYGCINCVHVLEDLKTLETKYHPYLAVIGVHTPKFDREKELKALRNIVVRYGIEHPVVNDVEFRAGRYYGMRAWPTQVVIDPQGIPLGKVIGEGNLDILDSAIAKLIEEQKDRLDPTPLPISLESEKLERSPLAAPGKVTISGRYVAISDTLHNRVVLADRSGKVLQVFGGPKPGHADGNAINARFSSPQGIVINGNKIYVADTGNHLIRALDIVSEDVTTIAGDSSMEQPRQGKFKAMEIGLRSPWGLAIKDEKLYIAMAGSHQIWRLNLATGELSDYAGSGREGLQDGSLSTSRFSQPSGLSIQGDWLFVADAEDSAIRRINLKDEKVETLVGAGLFDFGDVDGSFDEARLQHVLGIAAIDAYRVIAADTYNHKIKLLDLRKKTVSTLPLKSPSTDASQHEPPRLDEPGGLTVDGNLVLIADTNNNRIMAYDIVSGVLSPWKIDRLNTRHLALPNNR